MKNLLIILLVILIAGCHGTKKAAESRVIAAKTTEIKESTAAQLLVSIDTTKQSDTETTYTKVEYYPPASEPTSTASRSVGAPNSGPVKSVETLTIKKTTETKGKTEAVQHEVTGKTTEVAESTDTKTELKEQPAPDPKRWMWIFGILALLTGLIVYLRNSPVIKSVLSVVRKFLKI